jgi:integrase
MRVPKYRKQTGRDFAFVEHEGRRHRLPGRYNSPESRDAYKQFLARVLGKEELPPLVGAADEITVQVLVAVFMQYAEKRYPPGKRSEFANCKYGLKPFLDTYGDYLAVSIGPLKIKALQKKMTAAGRLPGYVNTVCGKIKRAYKWAASEELIPIAAYQALLTVPGLPEPKHKKKPVPQSDYEAIASELSPTIAAMAAVQWHTGVRSESICFAKPEQFDRSRNPWYWRPKHKTEHRGVDLVIPIGPRCQAVLLPFLERRKPGQFLFNPQDARANRRYNDHYAPGTYRQHIQRAIDKINEDRRQEAKQAGTQPVEITRWSPHGLRHSKGHSTRDRYGAEAAQAILGHESLDATAIYSDKRLGLAVEVAKEMG